MQIAFGNFVTNLSNNNTNNCCIQIILLKTKFLFQNIIQRTHITICLTIHLISSTSQMEDNEVNKAYKYL